jgi:SulP family sulfate permease
MMGPGVLPTIALLSGIITLFIWVFRLDRYIVFIPSSVVHGFTLSVAFVIGLGQLNSALGLQGLPSHNHFMANVIESLKHLDAIHLPTFGLFAIGLASLFALLKFAPKLPNFVIVAVGGILVGYASSKGLLPFDFQTVQSKFGNISLDFSMPHYTRDMFSSAVLKATPLVAIIVVLETLLSAKIADGMTKTKFNQKKEMFGVGIANIMSGLFGGLPATGVFARTALNIRSGAKSKWSAIINTVLVLIISLLLLPYFSYLPLAVVASILVFLSLRMVSREHFANLYRFDKTAFGLSIVVAFVCLWYDALVGILFGSVVALLIFANYLSKAQGEVIISENDQLVAKFTPEQFPEYASTIGDTLVYRFVGELNYMNSQRHISAMHHLKAKDNIILNFNSLFYIDVDGLDTLDEIIEEFETSGKKVFIAGISPFIMPLFHKKKWFKEKEEREEVFATQQEAVQKIKANQ